MPAEESLLRRAFLIVEGHVRPVASLSPLWNAGREPTKTLNDGPAICLPILAVSGFPRLVYFALRRL